MTKFDERMRSLEEPFDLHLDVTKPIIVRVDGKNFHDYHRRHFNGSFDDDMQLAMALSLEFVMNKFKDIDFGYTNSDELTFILLPKNGKVALYSGRANKLNTLFASAVSAKFNQVTGFDEPALFDARSFNASSRKEVIDNLHWRHLSGMRNSSNIFARRFIKGQAYDHKSTQERNQMLLAMGQRPKKHDIFYYGAFIARKINQQGSRIAKGNMNEIADVYLSYPS